jgi:hypothetical protein
MRSMVEGRAKLESGQSGHRVRLVILLRFVAPLFVSIYQLFVAILCRRTDRGTRRENAPRVANGLAGRA